MITYWTLKGECEGDFVFPQLTSLHRIDGPALILRDGTSKWFLEGVEYSLEEFVKLTPHLTNDGERLNFYLRWK